MFVAPVNLCVVHDVGFKENKLYLKIVLNAKAGSCDPMGYQRLLEYLRSLTNSCTISLVPVYLPAKNVLFVLKL